MSVVSLIMLDSVVKVKQSIILKRSWESAKIKRAKMEKFINHDLDPSSSDESDKSDSDSDNETGNKSDNDESKKSDNESQN